MDLSPQGTPTQRFSQWWYGVLEPWLLRYSDFMLGSERRRRFFIRQHKPAALPRGIIITTELACRFVDHIYALEGDDAARMAVTECVCQTALGRTREPVRKDMALLYAAEMYTTMAHTGIDQDFERIDTAEEAKAMLRSFHQAGLMHNALYCNDSGRSLFVMCNCDDEICVPFRSYMAGRQDEMGAGPEIVQLSTDGCPGTAACGRCLERCILKASYTDEQGLGAVHLDKCLGCGLCTSTCPGGVRTMVEREDYRFSSVFDAEALRAT